MVASMTLQEEQRWRKNTIIESILFYGDVHFLNCEGDRVGIYKVNKIYGRNTEENMKHIVNFGRLNA